MQVDRITMRTHRIRSNQSDAKVGVLREWQRFVLVLDEGHSLPCRIERQLSVLRRVHLLEAVATERLRCVRVEHAKPHLHAEKVLEARHPAPTRTNPHDTAWHDMT